MARRRKAKKKVDRQAVLDGRARGLSYSEIGFLLKISPSAAWYAEHRQPGVKRRPPPAGAPRCVYAPDREWGLLAEWAREARVSRSVLLTSLIAAEAERRSARVGE